MSQNINKSIYNNHLKNAKVLKLNLKNRNVCNKIHGINNLYLVKRGNCTDAPSFG
jgi:hypothetical protein